MGSPSEILGLTIGVANKITGDGVVYGLNLFWWVILSSDFQGIERIQFLFQPGNLLKILVLSSYYFPLTLTQELNRIVCMTTKTVMMMTRLNI